MKRSTGFTLLEVLVALAVLAIAMGAIINAATQSAVSTAYLRDQTLASWVALNKINELLLDPKPWPEEDSLQGNADLANRTWHWKVRFMKTDDPGLRQLEITVRSTDTAPVLSELTAFNAKPPEKQPDGNQADDSPNAREQSPESPLPRNAPRKNPSQMTPR